MSEYLLIFLAGVAGSFHCLGMCGGFVCTLGAQGPGGWAGMKRHLLYNSARVCSYVFLGALVGALGGALIAHDGPSAALAAAPRLLAVAAGVLILVFGLQLLGLLPRLRLAHAGAARVGQGVAVSVRGLLTAPGSGAPLAFGVANGFLPCPLVYAFLAMAAARADVGSAALTMLAFGLGTFPAMLLTGGVGRLLAPVWRRRGVWIAGAFLLALGAITLARGLLPLTGHMH